MKLLVFQHIACEHPGILRQFLAEDGIDWVAVELDEGEAIPSLDGFDALWVMGGPMDVWEEEDHPWLVQEKQAIRHWVNELKRPFLGFCLGHQLLADALGGVCRPQVPAEIGICSVELTQEGCADGLFAGLPPRQQCLQWHAVQVAQPPENSIVLAKSDLCGVQALRVGAYAWSMQYHVEIEPDTVSNWAAIPAYRQALEKALGRDALPKMQREADLNMKQFSRSARLIYNNFKAFVENSNVDT